MSMPTHSIVNQESPFLLLPAEIRNEIYLFVAFRWLRNSNLVPLHAHRTKSVERPNIKDSRRTGYGLTQVCRQIREEFMPIFVKYNPVTVRLDHVVQYVEDFVRLPGQPDNRATANIHVTTKRDSDYQVDMRDIMLLKAIAPQFTVERWFLCAEIDKALDIKAGSLWHEFLLRSTRNLKWYVAADRVCVDCGAVMYVVDVLLYVNPELAEDWMWDLGLSHEHDDTFEVWAESLGVQGKIDMIYVDEEDDEDIVALRREHLQETKRRGRHICEECWLYDSV